MTRTSSLLLLDGDYADRLNALYAEARRIEGETPANRRASDSSAYKAAREAYEALRVEAEEAGTRVSLRAIGRKEWRALKEKHPPRSGEDVPKETAESDRMAGVNVETIEDDLVHAALVEPEFTSRAAFDEWVDGLAEADFQTILVRAWSLVNVAQIDPKSLPALPTRKSGGN